MGMKTAHPLNICTKRGAGAFPTPTSSRPEHLDEEGGHQLHPADGAVAVAVAPARPKQGLGAAQAERLVAAGDQNRLLGGLQGGRGDSRVGSFSLCLGRAGEWEAILARCGYLVRHCAPAKVRTGEAAAAWSLHNMTCCQAERRLLLRGNPGVKGAILGQPHNKTRRSPPRTPRSSPHLPAWGPRVGRLALQCTLQAPQPPAAARARRARAALLPAAAVCARRWRGLLLPPPAAAAQPGRRCRGEERRAAEVTQKCSGQAPARPAAPAERQALPPPPPPLHRPWPESVRWAGCCWLLHQRR